MCLVKLKHVLTPQDSDSPEKTHKNILIRGIRGKYKHLLLGDMSTNDEGGGGGGGKIREDTK